MIVIYDTNMNIVVPFAGIQLVALCIILAIF